MGQLLPPEAEARERGKEREQAAKAGEKVEQGEHGWSGGRCRLSDMPGCICTKHVPCRHFSHVFRTPGASFQACLPVLNQIKIRLDITVGVKLDSAHAAESLDRQTLQLWPASIRFLPEAHACCGSLLWF